MQEVVVITGPIGSGKSSVASKLANRFNDAGRTVAVVDVDEIVAMLRVPPEDAKWTWETARTPHGRLVGEWLSAGVDAVIAHGPFHSRIDDANLMRHIPSEVATRRVMLLATYEVALNRVKSDPSRGLSRDPTFLASTYEVFNQRLPEIEPCEWTFDTSICSVDDVVTTLADALIRT